VTNITGATTGIRTGVGEEAVEDPEMFDVRDSGRNL
jgi:hypothetical protein